MLKSFTDMMNREVVLNFPPKKIISVVPSQTELLFDLGLDNEVIGITKFCVHPNEWYRTKIRIGGTKKLDFEKIKSLQPDLIIANKEENEQEQIETLAKEFPVWISDIKTVDDAQKMIEQIGALVDKRNEAAKILVEIKQTFTSFANNYLPKKVVYFIWYQPWMVAGGDTFINSMLMQIGWGNIFQNKNRYPEINLDDLKSLQPEMILLSSEPFPFKQQHIDELKTIFPYSNIKLVDGEMFSWYGSRMIKAIPYFKKLLIE